MKKAIPLLIFLISLLIIIITFTIYYLNSNKDITISQDQAISIIQAVYPEFKDYPRDNLPPRSIQTEQISNGWFISFIQEGSGRPILEAKCFFVKNDKSIEDIGIFKPSLTQENDFSIKTCK